MKCLSGLGALPSSPSIMTLGLKVIIEQSKVRIFGADFEYFLRSQFNVEDFED